MLFYNNLNLKEKKIKINTKIDYTIDSFRRLFMDNQHILDYIDCTKGKRKWKDMFQVVFEHTLSVLKKEGSYEVSLSIQPLDQMQKYNKEYRSIDKPTDVLTFAYQEADLVKDEPIFDLGDILLSVDIAKKQAKEYKHPLERELSFLFIHGLLHAFGYDHHRSEKEAEEMFALQNYILNTLPYDFYTNLNKVKKILLEAQSHSISPYSNFKVGAIVMTKDGKYHRGFNIENSAFGVSICAERCALFHTYASGYTKDDIVSLSLITSSSNVGSPCGSCRQVISELMNMNCPVYIFNNDETEHIFTTVKELLPFAFTPEDYYA